MKRQYFFPLSLVAFIASISLLADFPKDHGDDTRANLGSLTLPKIPVVCAGICCPDAQGRITNPLCPQSRALLTGGVLTPLKPLEALKNEDAQQEGDGDDASSFENLSADCVTHCKEQYLICGVNEAKRKTYNTARCNQENTNCLAACPK